MTVSRGRKRKLRRIRAAFWAKCRRQEERPSSIVKGPRGVGRGQECAKAWAPPETSVLAKFAAVSCTRSWLLLSKFSVEFGYSLGPHGAYGVVKLRVVRFTIYVSVVDVTSPRTCHGQQKTRLCVESVIACAFFRNDGEPLSLCES